MKNHYISGFSKIFFGLTLAIGVLSCNDESIAKLNEQTSKDTTKTDIILSDLKIPVRRVDVGNVEPDKTISGVYSIVNTGPIDLIIEYVNPDCTCTGFTLSKKQIPPGDSARLVLNMSTKDKEGEVAVHATISANTMTRLYQVSLLANVLSEK